MFNALTDEEVALVFTHVAKAGGALDLVRLGRIGRRLGRIGRAGSKRLLTGTNKTFSVRWPRTRNVAAIVKTRSSAVPSFVSCASWRDWRRALTKRSRSFGTLTRFGTRFGAWLSRTSLGMVPRAAC